MVVWQGASGAVYPHVAFTLVGCPPIASGTFVFVRQLGKRRSILGIGRTMSPVASLNLAAIRRQGACLGADEVHLYGCEDEDCVLAAIIHDIAMVGEATPPAGAACN